MCRLCKTYGSRLHMTPMNPKEQRAWNMTVGIFGYNTGYKMFLTWHKWFVKE